MRRQPLTQICLWEKPLKTDKSRVLEETNQKKITGIGLERRAAAASRRRTNSDNKDQREAEASASKDAQEYVSFGLFRPFVSSLLVVVGATGKKWRQTQKDDEMTAEKRAHRRIVSVCSLAAVRRDKRSKSGSEIADYSPKTQLLLLPH